MSLFDVERLVERILARINVEEIAGDVMSKIKIERLDLYFVVLGQPGLDDYEFLGMAYSLEAARELAAGNRRTVHIFKSDMGKLVGRMEEMGIIKKVEEVQ